MSPSRVQRKRIKGWRMPEGSVYVGRPTKWGNPFKGEVGAATASRQMLVEDYERWLFTPCWTDPRDGELRARGGNCTHHLGVPYSGRPTVAEIRTALAGKDLACWCPDGQPCHADVLLAVANRVGGGDE